MKSLKFGSYEIMNDATMYFITYAGGKRELCAKDQKEYDRAIQLPWEAQRNELKRLGHEKNPNLVPIRGDKLIEMIKERRFVPFFDQFFAQSHLLVVNDVVVFESMKAKSYEMALGR